MIQSEYRFRQEIVRVTQNVANQGLILSSFGNISIRMDQDRLLASTSGHNKMSKESVDSIIVNKVGDSIPLIGFELDRLW